MTNLAEIIRDEIRDEIIREPEEISFEDKYIVERAGRKKTWIKSDAEKEIWVEKDISQTNFIWVKYADEDKKRELKECRRASQFFADGDYLYYVKDSYFFRIHMKKLTVEFIDEKISDFRIFKDTAIAIKYEKQEGTTETKAVFLEISLTDMKKRLVNMVIEKEKEEQDHFLSYAFDRVCNFEFNEKYLVWILRTNLPLFHATENPVDYLMVTELATGKIRKLAEWSFKYRLPGVTRSGGSGKYEENVIKLDDDWIYIKRIWDGDDENFIRVSTDKNLIRDGDDIENFKISYDGTQKEILN